MINGVWLAALTFETSEEPPRRLANDQIIITKQATVGFATKLTVLLFVELLEDRALIPIGSFELLQRLVELSLRDVQNPNFQHLVSFGVVDDVMESPPCTLKSTKIFMMNDLIHLFGELLVNRRYQAFYVFHRVVTDDNRLNQKLLGEGLQSQLLLLFLQYRSWAETLSQ